MDPRLLVLGLLALIAILELLTALRRQRRKRRSQEPPIYAVGSPEDNARVVQAIRKLNEQLAPEGKRVPERVVIDIIRQRTHGQGDDNGNVHV